LHKNCAHASYVVYPLYIWVILIPAEPFNNFRLGGCFGEWCAGLCGQWDALSST